MGRWKSEEEARNQIKEMVARYYKEFKAPVQQQMASGDGESKENPEPGFQPQGRISYAGRVYDEKEMQSLTDAMLDFWLTAGRFSEAFEKAFAEWMGIKYAHIVNSGSSANLLAFMVLTAPELGKRRICRGDEVITVAGSFPTTVAPVIQYGAVPVFVDLTIPQYNIDVSQLENALSDKTKAVMIAHTLGNPFDLKAVREFCDRYELWLVEDNCDSLGATYTIDGETRYTGTWGDIGTSSFYPPHHMTMGEGGCVYTDDPQLHRLILSYRDWGRDCICPPGQDNYCGHRFDRQFGDLPKGYDHKYVYSHFGYNLKATDMQAAVGLEQLKKLPGFIEKRKHNWKRLRSKLECVEDRLILPEPAANSEPSWFGFLITIRPQWNPWDLANLWPGENPWAGLKLEKGKNPWTEAIRGAIEGKSDNPWAGLNLGEGKNPWAALELWNDKKLWPGANLWPFPNFWSDTDSRQEAKTQKDNDQKDNSQKDNNQKGKSRKGKGLFPGADFWTGTVLKRNDIIQYLEDHHVQTRLLFSGNIIKHPCFDNMREVDAQGHFVDRKKNGSSQNASDDLNADVYRVAGSLKTTNYIMNNSFWVGVYPGMTDEMIDYIGDKIIEAVDNS